MDGKDHGYSSFFVHRQWSIVNQQWSMRARFPLAQCSAIACHVDHEGGRSDASMDDGLWIHTSEVGKTKPLTLHEESTEERERETPQMPHKMVRNQKPTRCLSPGTYLGCIRRNVPCLEAV